MSPDDPFTLPPPRRAAAVAPLVRAASRHVRWFWYAVLLFDAACLAVILGTASPDDRMRYFTAFLVVFGLFTLPFYLLYRRSVRTTRRLFAEGQVVQAEVVKVRTGSMRGTPVHHVRVQFTDAQGRQYEGHFSMAGGKSAMTEGDGIRVMHHAELRSKLFVAATPAHGVQPGRLE